MTEQVTEKQGWLSRLKQGLKKTSTKISKGVEVIFTHRKLDEDTLAALEDLLLSADLGVSVTQKLLDALRKNRFGQDITEAEVRALLAEEMTKILQPFAGSLTLDPTRTNVILMVGINGSGKTTTLSKLAAQWKGQGLSVRMVAGDTFRAAAVKQLQIWGERLGIPVVFGADGADVAGLVYEAYIQAQKKQEQVLLVDTAGRLHTRHDLMAELEKVVRVLKKVDAAAPHHTVMVVDATIGQNVHTQLETFQKWVPITGLVMTKLDGTARGGVLVGLAEKFQLPIHAIGIGESADDLRPFEADAFANSLVSIEN